MDIEFNGTSTHNNGMISGRKIIFHPNAVLIATGSLEIQAEDDLLISGLIVTADGIDVTLTSLQGRIFVGGGVSTGAGKNGRDPGQSGTRGGNLALKAPQGEIVVIGSLKTGAGGNGQDNKARGDCVGGAAGDGGSITANSEQIIIRRTAEISSGNGGNGGKAVADGWSDAAAQEWAEIMGDTKPEDFVPDEQVSVERLIASSGNGGLGGTISLQATQTGVLEGSLKSGNGGDAGHAQATRTFNATAQTGRPGKGGPINIVGNAANWTLGGTVELGSGGSYFRPILSNCAIASARDAALAKTALPGKAGQFTRPNGNQPQVREGSAGLPGAAHARSLQGNCDKTDSPGTENRAAEARCPNP